MKYLAEAIGTFALVFCGTGAIIVDQQTNALTHVGISFAFGTIVMVMVYALRGVSGAHINPAVTIAAAIARKFPVIHILPYILSQIAGAVLASLLLSTLFPENEHLGTTLPAGAPMQSFVLEFVFTFFLMLVILAVTSKQEWLPITGLAIGSTVLLGAMVAGPISGGSFNPARSIAPALISWNLESLWIYILAPVLGAIAAAWLWPRLHPEQ